MILDRDYQMLTFAGLFHDIGKFCERAGDYKEKEPKKIDQKYSHAWYSYIFLDNMFNWSDQSDTNGTNIADLASFHHNPKNNVFNWILAEADRQASGHERTNKEVDNTEEKIIEKINERGKENIPLYPITERVARKEGDIYIEKDNVESFFPLSVITDIKNIYPLKSEELKNYKVKEAYKEHYKSFKEEFGSFCSELKRNKSEEFFKNFITFKSILQKYLWCIPQDSRYQSLPDVSLFEHLKLTAMLSGALYHYHKEKHTLDIDSIQDRTEKKYLLVSGDLSGIQKFIYDIDSKGAFKTLKGHSFFMQLLPYIISKRLLDKLEMNESPLLYSTGGHFYMVLPNLDRVKSILKDEFEGINYELFDKFDGKIFLRSGYEEFSPDLLDNKNKDDDYNFSSLWDYVQKKISKSDRKKYSIISKIHYDKIFNPGFDNERNKSINFSEIGLKLQKNSIIVLVRGDKYSYKLLGYSFDLFENIQTSKTDTVYLLLDGSDFSLDKKSFISNTTNISFFPTGGLEGFYNKTFDDIAKNSKGSNLIGILRMDVDNLGKIFSEGLLNYNHKQNYKRKDFGNDKSREKFNFYSIGRITTLSSQLIMFFSLCIEDILSKEKYRDKIIIVYSGGDDLFLLGEWQVMPSISIEINKKFKEFVCENPAFSLSGGITLVPGKYPIYKAAELAGEAEQHSKEFERILNGEKTVKNSISFMGQSFDWDEFEKLNTFVDDFSNKKGYKPLIDRINLIAQAHQVAVENKKKYKKKSIITEREILNSAKAERWQWLMVYSFARMQEQYKDNKDIKELSENIKKYFINNLPDKEKTGIENANILGKWLRNYTRKI